MSLKRTILFFAFPAFITIASCATLAPVDPSTADSDLAELRKEHLPTFSGIGRLKAKGTGGSFTGSMALAIDGRKYRIEIYDSIGQTIFAGGGVPGSMLEINPKTGERKTFTGKNARVARFNDFTIPLVLLKTMVYASPPAFTRVISSFEKKERRIAKTEEPQMEIEYSSQIERITMTGDEEEGEDDLVITIGKLAKGPIAPYAKSAHIDFDGGSVTLDIRWKKVKQGIIFPKGFFTFDDLPE